MATLTTMFPQMPPQRIAQVLIDMRGHMEDAIAALLSNPEPLCGAPLAGFVAQVQRLPHNNLDSTVSPPPPRTSRRPP